MSLDSRSPRDSSGVGPASPPETGVYSCREYLGQVLGERYRLLSVLGQGGMGSVFFARHTLVGRPLAVKIMGCRHVTELEGMTRLFREAQAAAAIGHPNIVDIIDVGVSRRGDPYLVMEYLEGEDLASFMRREGPVSVAAACAILEPILLALSAAHRKGIVHRDLKPANIYLTLREDGAATVKLIDFGIAKVTIPAGDSRLTMTGAMLGTPSYMAPEQAIGVADVDARADLYALGVILYQLVAGRLPFEGANYNEIIFRIVNDEPRSPESIPGIPPDAGAIIRKAIGKLPSTRYQTAADLLEALRALDSWGSRTAAFAQLSLRIKPGTHGDEEAGTPGPSLPTPSVGGGESSGTPERRPAMAAAQTRSGGPVESPERTQLSQQYRSEPAATAPTDTSPEATPPGVRIAAPAASAETRISATDPSQLAGHSRAARATLADSLVADARRTSPPAPPSDSDMSDAEPAPEHLDGTARVVVAPVPVPAHAETRAGVYRDTATTAREHSWWPRAGAAAAVLVVVAAALWVLGSSITTPRTNPSTAGANTKPLSTSDGASPQSAEVLITVNDAPRGASIAYDGERVFTNPFRVPRANTPIAIEVRAAGFLPFVATLVPNHDATLNVRLRPAAGAIGSSTPTPTEADGHGPSASPRPVSSSAAPVVKAKEDSRSQPAPAAGGSKVPAPAASGSAAPTSSAKVHQSARGTLYTEEFD